MLEMFKSFTTVHDYRRRVYRVVVEVGVLVEVEVMVAVNQKKTTISV